jgi:SdrD B-like domain
MGPGRTQAQDNMARQMNTKRKSLRRSPRFLARLLLVYLSCLSMVHQSFADIVNSAVAEGTFNSAPVTSSPSMVSIPVTLATPAIALEKTSTFNDESGDGAAQLGETISYQFRVTNTGNVTLTNITLADANVTLSGGPIASLAPGLFDATTFTATHTITLADLGAGQVLNSATVTGTSPSGTVTDVSDSQNPGDDTGGSDDPTTTQLPDAVIDAVDNNFSTSPINSFTGGSTPTVLSNDTLNGSPFAAPIVTTTVVNDGGLTGVTVNPDGTLNVPAGTPPATYTVRYRICEVANPTNCDEADATNVVVQLATIDAQNDDFTPTPINGLTGGTTTTVFVNDTLNGNPFAPAIVTPTVTADGGLTGVAINPDGTLTIPAGTPAGSYVVSYTICEGAQPANCDSANATVVIAPPVIDAVADDFTASPINGLAGGATPTVYTNDTLNGVAFAPAAVTPTITANGGLTGVTINTSGALVVPAGTAAGTYSVTYQICEVLNPTNCDTAIATVVINAATIVATDDDFTAVPINGFSGGATTTVYVNDTLNGAAFAPAAVTPTVTADGGLTGVTINPDGTLTVPAGTPAGSYAVTYRICEALNATNCDIAIATVLINPPAIAAIDDDFTASPVNGLTGGTTATVYTNDTLNGAAFASGAVTPAIIADGGLTGAVINANGTLTVPAGTVAGTYSVTYQICEVLNSTNCDTAIATVVVNPPAIAANDDDFTASPVNGLSGGSTPTVFTNDKLNGAPFTPGAVTPSVTANGGLAGVSINPDGTLTVPAGTPAATYSVTYQICEVLNPANCDTAIVTVVVNAATIDAVDNDFSSTPFNSAAGGATATVYNNDTLNGAPFAPAAVTSTITANGGLAGAVINPDGTITVPPGTPPATYVVTYRICEAVNAANCDTANATIVVSALVIDAVDNDFTLTPVNGLTGGATPTVFANDTLNGAPFAATAVTPTITATGGLTGVTINANGTLSVPANTPAGTYVVGYRICEAVNLTNCDTANATVLVNPPAIVANDDDFTPSPVNGLSGGATPTVFTNDTLNGAPFAPGAVTATITAAGGLTGVTITASGTLVVPAGTPAATYNVTYRICEVLNPTNCDTAIATVVVSAATIDAVDNDFTATPIGSTAGGTTATVFSNDTLNGAPFASTAVTPSITANGGLTGVVINTDGTLTVPAGSAPGTYTVSYRICEVANPTNCDTANALITVSVSLIDAVDNNFTPSPINGLTGGTTPTVFGNDTLNGAPFLPAAVIPTITATGGLTGVSINPAGTLTVPANTPAGTYTVGYQICEAATPTNCDTANAIVVVNPPAIVANDDDFTASPVNGLTGGASPTIYANDTLNGAAFVPAAVTPTIVAAGGLTGVTVNADGTLNVPLGTPAATYNVTYQICEVLNPANCDTAIATVLVSAATIDAVDNDFTSTPFSSVSGGTTTTVFTNDTLNGSPFLSTAVTPVITANGGLTGVTINPDGTITIPPGATPGTYTVSYRICEVANSTNCDTANVAIVIATAVIDAVDNDFTPTPINGLTGGATPTVFNNDTLNGTPFVATAVTPTIVTNGGLSGVLINADGTLTVPPGTPAGSYTVNYRICETANATNCDTANAIVVVSPPVIIANDDDFTASPINGTAGGATLTVFGNDTLNGAAFGSSAVTAIITANGGVAGLTITPAGLLTIPAGTLPATYSITYQICEVLNPTNCDTAVATVLVTAPAAAIVATDDDFSAPPVTSTTGGTTATVFINDTLNGVPFAPASVTPSITSNGGLAGAVINPNGTIIVPAGTVPGTYNVVYQICETANSGNCDTATAIIQVNPPAIVAGDNDFSGSPIIGATGGTTASVFGNDTLNGAAFAPSLVIPSVIANGGLTNVAINADGTLSVPAGTLPGTYIVTYRICEVANPTNCDQANATIVVPAPVALASVSGTVFFDSNGDGLFNGGDPPAGAGYVVQLVNASGTIVDTVTTQGNGTYAFSTVAPGLGYSLVFTSPTGAALGTITNLALNPGQTIVDQNQPIDPSGIVYNSVTGLPVAGVTVTLADLNNVPLPTACFIAASQQNQVTGINGAYRFDLVPGAAAACPVGQTEYHILVANPAGYQTGISTTVPPQAGALDATACATPPAACQVSPSANPPTIAGTGVYYTAILLELNDPHVVNNHIPIDPIAAPSTAAFTKKALIGTVHRGERVPYVIEATQVAINPARMVDIMPVGFDFVPGSATVNGAPVTPTISGNILTFDGLIPNGAQTIKLELLLTVTVAAANGPKVNKAQLIDPSNGAIIGTAQATVTVMVDHVFDCGDIIGKVFDDKNRNGYQDEGEIGLPGVRLVTVKGVQITTDKNGQFHVACADVPDASIGSNFILKLDTRTLPSGYRVTSENPRIVRLTQGKVSKLNFGASITRVVRFDVTGDAFVDGTSKLKPEWVGSVDKLIGILDAERSTLRLTYYAKSKGSELAAKRLAGVAKLVAEKWKAQSDRYDLPIERRLIGPKAQLGK